MRVLFEAVPLYRAWYRVRLGWTFNDRIHSALQRDPDWDHPERSLNAQNDAHRKYFTRYVVDELGDRADELLDKVLPTYPPFGKRMLMDNGWYRMLRNPNVELVDDPIAEISGQTIRTSDGSQREADVLVLATGFDVLRFITTYEAVGRSGGRCANRGGTTTRVPTSARSRLISELLHPVWAQSAAWPRRKPHLRRGDAGPIHHGHDRQDVCC